MSWPGFAPKLEGDSLMRIYKYGVFNLITTNINWILKQEIATWWLAVAVRFLNGVGITLLYFEFPTVSK